MNKYFVNISLEVDINKYDNIQAIVDSFDLIGSAENTEILEVTYEKVEQDWQSDSSDEDY
jgi:hypothetical protein